MAHELSLLSASLVNKPQLITPDTFNHYLSILENRSSDVILANQEAKKLALEESVDIENKSEVDLGATVGIINIEGPLTYKSSGFEALCGGASYQGILSEAKELFANPSIKTVVQIVNSGGGECFRCFEHSRELRKLADETGKRFITYVDGMSASAAYALSVASHEVIINPDSEVGSIGVVVRLVNSNEKDKKEGYQTTYITAGDSKVPFDANGDFREDFKADLQTKVDSLYLDFIQHVADMRNISQEVVMSTEAKTFMKDDALKLGLVDKVMTGAEFKEYLQESVSVGNTNAKTPIAFNNNKQDIEMSNANLDDQAVAALQAKLDEQAAMIAKFQAKEVEAQLSTLVSTLSTENTFLKEDTIKILASTMLSADEGVKTLLSNVLAEAKAGYSAVEARAVEDIAKAEEATEKALADKEAIKAEFGEKQTSVADEPKDAVVADKQDAIRAKVAAKKAAMKAQ